MHPRTLVSVGIGIPMLIALTACADSISSRHSAFATERESAPAPGATSSRPRTTLPTLEEVAPVDYPGIRNVVAFAPDIYSGSMPDRPLGIATLGRLGVKTIISVDGAKPDVDGAAALGMRYVHLPVGYDGMTDARSIELARAARDLPKPMYIHCHHGKHRSACAAGAVAVILGASSPEQAVDRMNISGTSPSYPGLFAAVRSARRLDDASIDMASDEFPAVAKTRGTVDAMVAIDHAFDHLKLIKAAGWTTPTDHPDLVPAAEAGILADHLRTLLQDPDSVARGEAYLALMMDASTSAAAAETLLASAGPRDTRGLDAALARVSQDCVSCHQTYRNVPKR